MEVSSIIMSFGFGSGEHTHTYLICEFWVVVNVNNKWCKCERQDKFVYVCVRSTRRDFTMMHNACIPVCALIHLLSWLPGLPYTGLVRIIKSDSFLFHFMQVFQARSDLFTCTAVSQRYWFSVSLKTCISFHNNVYRISTALRGFPLMWLWSDVWTQMRGLHSSLNLALLPRGCSKPDALSSSYLSAATLHCRSDPSASPRGPITALTRTPSSWIR